MKQFFHSLKQINNIFALTNKGIFKSGNFGSNWSSSNNGLPYSSINIINTITSNQNTLFTGTQWGIYSSTDEG